MRSSRWMAAAFAGLTLLAGAAVSAGPSMIKDTESATHGDDAARHQVVDTYSFPGFEVVFSDV